MSIQVKYITCPYCGKKIKKGNGHHINHCKENWIKNNFTSELKTKLYRLYIDEQRSIRDICECLNCELSIDVNSSLIRNLLEKANIRQRNLKEANSTKRRDELIRKTNLERYGYEHNFCKEHPSRKRWEQRLLEEEGITNVFQRESVKKKIYETNLNKYGLEGMYYNRAKGAYLDYYIEKYGEELGTKKFNWVQKQKGCSSKQSYIERYGDLAEKKWRDHIEKISKSRKYLHYEGLNNKFEKLLIDNNIKTFEREYRIICNDTYYSYDFKIGNIIVELNGSYWHCSPRIYQPNDIIKFPNNKFIRAKDKWKQDNYKLNIARSNGYEVVVIWEDLYEEQSYNFIKQFKNNQNGNCKD